MQMKSHTEFTYKTISIHQSSISRITG
uniref:Uncharacterized protein n=1 Tax=Lotus japonicus TaxID=34305 RepID=I3SSM2_LOTJA|nr:unknown [Lotus japonicus]